MSPRQKSARTSLAATRSRSVRADTPARWSPDFSSLALAKTSRRSAKVKCSPRIVVWYDMENIPRVVWTSGRSRRFLKQFELWQGRLNHWKMSVIRPQFQSVLDRYGGDQRIGERDGQ